MTKPCKTSSDAQSTAAYSGIITLIAARIESQGMKGKDVAEAAGISESYLSEISRGKKQTSMKLLHRIAAVVGLTITHQVNG